MSDTYNVFWRNLRATKEELTDFLSNNPTASNLESILAFERKLILVKSLTNDEIKKVYSVSGMISKYRDLDSENFDDQEYIYEIEFTRESERWPLWRYSPKLKNNKGNNIKLRLDDDYTVASSLSPENMTTPIETYIFDNEKAFLKLQKTMDENNIREYTLKF